MAPDVPPQLRRLSRRLLPAVAALFAAGALLQAYQAGQATLGGDPMWSSHIAVGHGLSALAVAAVAMAYLAPFGTRVRRLAWLLLASYYATVGLAVFRFTDGLGPVAALHPVGAFVAFLAAALLAGDTAPVNPLGTRGSRSGSPSDDA